MGRRKSGKRTRQAASRVFTPPEVANDHAASHGLYVMDFVHHDESGTKTQAQRNRVSSIVDRWFLDGGVGFDEPQRRAVNHCIVLWHRMGTIGKLTAKYGDRVSGSAEEDRTIEARDEMHQIKGWFPLPYWDVFENVVRWGMAAGTAGSDLANNSPQQIAAARSTVGFVASIIAMRKGY